MRDAHAAEHEAVGLLLKPKRCWRKIPARGCRLHRRSSPSAARRARAAAGSAPDPRPASAPSSQGAGARGVDHHRLAQHRRLARRDREVGQVGAEMHVDRQLTQPLGVALKAASRFSGRWTKISSIRVRRARPTSASTVAPPPGAAAPRHGAKAPTTRASRPSRCTTSLAKDCAPTTAILTASVPALPSSIEIGPQPEPRRDRGRDSQSEPQADPQPGELVADLVEEHDREEEGKARRPPGDHLADPLCRLLLSRSSRAFTKDIALAMMIMPNGTTTIWLRSISSKAEAQQIGGAPSPA